MVVVDLVATRSCETKVNFEEALKGNTRLICSWVQFKDPRWVMGQPTASLLCLNMAISCDTVHGALCGMSLGCLCNGHTCRSRAAREKVVKSTCSTGSGH